MHDQMLESDRDDVKLEAMRCITVLMAKGKLSVPRTLFPHIVKNISSENAELKKLIHLYLANFSDQEPDLALLAVSTLQKSLKIPNPLIRASALKTLTSMRLNILSAILMTTIKNSVNDMSPYVRKTVAHSIIKLYRLEPSFEEELIEPIERLLKDKNSIVISSALATFEAVCPNRLDLLRPQFKRFCVMIPDCNEWGQVLLVNLLKRYVIHHYQAIKNKTTDQLPLSEFDPKQLLRSVKPLINSDNSAVVMAVVQLFIEIANHNEVRSTIVKPMLRLLHSHREIQLVVLQKIDELTSLDNEDDNSNGSDDQQDDDSEEDDKSIGNVNDNKIEDVTDNTVPNSFLDQIESIDDNKVEVEATDQETVEEQVIDDEEEYEEYEIEVEVSTSEEEDDGEESVEEDDKNSSKNEAPPKVTNNETIVSSLEPKRPNYELELHKPKSAFREMFRPSIKSFFVKNNDSPQVKLAKLKILTNLASSINVTQILKELQAYIRSYVEDKEFISASVHCIGSCAMNVKEVTHICLNKLTNLLSNSDENIVSEAIVVIRSQIVDRKSKYQQLNHVSKHTENSNENVETVDGSALKLSSSEINTDESAINDKDRIVSIVIKRVNKLLPIVTAPQARATILWIVAEFCGINLTAARCAPDILRYMAQNFSNQDPIVKLQTLSLASKLLISLDADSKPQLFEKVQLLTNYLFSLAKYDINHDVRDRGRFMKKLLLNQQLARQVLLFQTPTDTLSSLTCSSSISLRSS